jgi:hypothetical protein
MDRGGEGSAGEAVDAAMANILRTNPALRRGAAREPRATRRRRHRGNSLYTHRPAFAVAVERLRDADPGSGVWLSAFGCFELLRVLHARDPDGEIRLSDTRIADLLEISRPTWSKYSRLLERAGLLERIAPWVNGAEQRAGWRIVGFEALAGSGNEGGEPGDAPRRAGSHL